MHKIDKNIEQVFELIDKTTAYIRIPAFHSKDDFHSLFSKIEGYKKSPKKTINIVVVDLRGNNGGCGHCQSNLSASLIDKSILNITTNYEHIESIQGFFVLDKY